ncbi:MAG: MFS transporter, partial [Xanthobacteraceae bacterium]
MTSEIAPQDKPRIAGRIADAATPDVLHRGAHAATLEATRAPLDHAAARAIIFGIMLAMFLSALEQTIVAPALPAIGKSLANLDDLSWIVTAYLIAATAATPLFGKLSDIHGRRT